MLAHVPIALGVMLVGWLFGRILAASNAAAIWLSWFAAACTCIMREVTQQEYRWIESVGQGRRTNLPLFEGLRFWEWNSHSQIETAGALFVSALVAAAVARWA